jgi:two-component system, chemotaxis family, protein-glutamate methylesterase/glutaminase
MRKIRVLVVEDSLTARKRLVSAISSDAECEVIGEAVDGSSAIERCMALRPDVMTLDMLLPGASGIEVTEHVMAYCPTPIVIVSSIINRSEVWKTLDMLAAGAVDVLEKPRGDEREDEWERKLLDVVKLASRIKVITHVRGRKRRLDLDATTTPTPVPAPLVPAARRALRKFDLVAMGASTGGPSAVLEILGGSYFPVQIPILLTVHVGRPFGLSFAEWLGSVLPVPVCEAKDGELLPAPGEGRVIVSPSDRHLVVERGRLRLSNGPERNSCRPSIDVLFDSVAREKGARAIGVLLTGMGRDGAEGLLAMKQAGATTIVQDESSSVVFGMPREAIRLGAADHVLRLGEMRPFLRALSTPAGEKVS